MKFTVCSAASPPAMMHTFDYGATVAELMFICFLYKCLCSHPVLTDRLLAIHWE